MAHLSKAFFWSTAVMMTFATVNAALAACPIDYASGQAQYGAASGQLGFPISAPQECETVPPVSKFASAGPLGGSSWTGTGFGDYGVIRSEFTFRYDSGWWSWTPAMMGSFFFPDFEISGCPGAEAEVSVNFEYGGTASGSVPDSRDFAWRVDVRDGAGNVLDAAQSTIEYAPNVGTLAGSTPALTVPVGVPFSLEMKAQWTPGGGRPSTTTGSDFVQLQASGVMNLPPGCTLSSNSAGIVDNVFNALVHKDGFESES